MNLGHFRCHKRQLRTVYVQKCGFRRFWARKCPIKASKPNLMTYKGHFRHRIFTSGLNMRIPVSQKSLPMPSELFKYIWSEFRPLPVSLMGWNSPNFDHKIYEPAYVSSGQEEPCSCINNWTEISSKVFFNLYGNELKSKSLKCRVWTCLGSFVDNFKNLLDRFRHDARSAEGLMTGRASF